MSGLLKSLSRIRQVINIYPSKRARKPGAEQVVLTKRDETQEKLIEDRKSTRLNSSHGYISYAVFCLKKKKTPDLCLPLQRTRLLTTLSCAYSCTVHVLMIR